MRAHGALDFSSTHSPALFRHLQEQPLQVAEPVFSSLRGGTLDDRAAQQGLLLGDTLLDVPQIVIEGEWIVRLRHTRLLNPRP
jgi:hypothetical protein